MAQTGCTIRKLTSPNLIHKTMETKSITSVPVIVQ